MFLDPLLSAPWVIQLHAFGAIAAFFLGALQFAAPKGMLPHRMIGGVWIVLMATIAISSIFIRPALFPGLPFWKWFSPIHIFTILTIYGVAQGVFQLAKGGSDLKYHARPFSGIFIGGLIVAGAFAFLPGRIMHQVAFGG